MKSSAEQDLVEALLAATPVLVGVATRAVEHLDDGLSLAQFRLLLALAELGPVPSSTAAARLGAVASSVTRAADHLEESGHLRRHRERPNRSVVRLELTGTGRALVDRVLDRRRAELAALVDRLPHAVAGPLAEGLHALVAAAGGPGGGPMELIAR